ncbi:TPA: hypothetical protein R4A47_004307 [Salmonella enterica subsp. enterica serovar Schwarzengrund]|nr:hypothetical protein [Salmonella enterica subsp. enterica serovar Schwarzengrund]ECL1349771.1 hypothetical protein [Salmonella enterica]EBS6537790.1 hypothetical protein [Salmonella enterica subsp. enterica serovar Schwarzengrund]EBS6569929.1 hypothetical protein [Salmonella enterica subsp. enterica serovar Schwarzengrund]EBY5954589.1 hypothetical protein [Salmonella enterica subsp. enterica serovar Schwarzengrund]
MSNITLNTPYSGMIILSPCRAGKSTFLRQITSEHPDLFFNMDDNYISYTDAAINFVMSKNKFLLAADRILNRDVRDNFIKKGFLILHSVEEAKDYYNKYLNPIKIARKEQEELAEVFSSNPIKKRNRL